MKNYKVVIVKHERKSWSSKKRIQKTQERIQEAVDEYARNGYRLVSTNTSGSGSGFLFDHSILYFES